MPPMFVGVIFVSCTRIELMWVSTIFVLTLLLASVSIRFLRVSL